MSSSRNSSRAHTITKIELTQDTLTGRAGLNLFVRYFGSIEIAPLLDQLFGSLRKSQKGQAITEIFKQLFVFFIDGTCRHLSASDALKRDSGYAGVLESDPDDLLLSHSVKRFFKALSLAKTRLFSQLLQELFLWRLRLV